MQKKLLSRDVQKKEKTLKRKFTRYTYTQKKNFSKKNVPSMRKRNKKENKVKKIFACLFWLSSLLEAVAEVVKK